MYLWNSDKPLYGQISRKGAEAQSFESANPVMVIKITENRVAILAKARSRRVGLCVFAGVVTTSASGLSGINPLRLRASA